MRAEAVTRRRCPGPQTIHKQAFPIRRKLGGNTDLTQMHRTVRWGQAGRSVGPAGLAWGVFRFLAKEKKHVCLT